MQILRVVCVCFVVRLFHLRLFLIAAALIWWGWAWLSGMEENKKSGGGDVRAEALS